LQQAVRGPRWVMNGLVGSEILLPGALQKQMRWMAPAHGI